MKRQRHEEQAKAKKSAKKAAEPFFRPFKKIAPAAAKAKASDKPGEKEPVKKSPVAAKKRAPKVDVDARDPGGPRPVDPDTFAVYMAGVRALPEDRAHRIPRTASRVERVADADRAPPGDPNADARSRMRSLVTEGIRFEVIDDGAELEGRRLEVDPRELRRLRRAQYAVDGKLDLHGLAADEARGALDAFVKKRATEGDKVVLVVHGKGSHSPRGHAVLRGEIAAWLSQGRAARHVAAFASAPEDLGGAGALLVLLARS